MEAERKLRRDNNGPDTCVLQWNSTGNLGMLTATGRTRPRQKRQEMAAKTETFIQRMRNMPLSRWGAICFFSGIAANLAVTLMIQTRELPRAEERAARMGAAMGCGLFVLIGVALMVAHFVRRKSE
jgi:hypothetical protein